MNLPVRWGGESSGKDKREKLREFLEGINAIKEMGWGDGKERRDDGMALPWAKITRYDEQY